MWAPRAMHLIMYAYHTACITYIHLSSYQKTCLSLCNASSANQSSWDSWFVWKPRTWSRSFPESKWPGRNSPSFQAWMACLVIAPSQDGDLWGSNCCYCIFAGAPFPDIHPRREITDGSSIPRSRYQRTPVGHRTVPKVEYDLGSFALLFTNHLNKLLVYK